MSAKSTLWRKSPHSQESCKPCDPKPHHMTLIFLFPPEIFHTKVIHINS